MREKFWGLANTIDLTITRISERIVPLLNRIFDDNKIARILFLIIILLVLVGIYNLNHHTTLIVDDYNYSFSGGKKTESVVDIIVNQYHHYFNWGGRVVVHFFAQLFLMVDKQYFDVFNTIAYVLLVMVIYLHAVGKFKLYPSLLIIINCFFFLSMPAFGQVFLWLTGACNYLWGPLFALAYLLPYRFQAEKEESLIANKFCGFVYAFLGICAGWTNENIGITLSILIGVFSLVYYFQYNRVHFWMKCAFIGSLIGAFMLIVAPGNFVRLGVIAAGSSSGKAVHLIRNLFNITKMLIQPQFLLGPLSIVSILFVTVSKSEKLKYSYIYLLGMILSMYAMVAAPFFADRAKAGTLYFAVITLCSLYVQLDFKNINFKKVTAICISTFTILTLFNYRIANRDIRAYEQRNKAKIAHVLSEKLRGNTNVVISRNYPGTKYCAAWGLEDISKNVKHWTNTGFARYFGLNSVKTE